MRHLPIQDGANVSRIVDQEISGAIVAMHHADLLSRRRWIALQPAQGRASDRLWFAFVLVDDLLPARYFVHRGLMDILGALEVTETDLVRIGCGDISQNGEKLPSDLLAVFAVGIGTHDAA